MAKKSSKRPSKKKKVTAKKSSVRKVKKIVARKKVARKKSPLKKSTKIGKKKVSRAVLPTQPEGEVVGTITHYFPHVKAGVIQMSANLSLGDSILIKGHTTNFKQKVTSMQVNNQPIEAAKPQDEVGILVEKRVRQHDVVYKL
jgi:LytS/YehU family sensor histidine kinase